MESRTTFAPFIALDGIDGTGKSTQCRLLASWLRSRGLTVTECVDPGGTPLGLVIREILLGQRHSMTLCCEALLFMASRAQLVAEVIRPALNAGQAVVSDRFLLANIVYQGHAGGLDPEQLRAIALFATADLAPDLTVVLDLSPAEAAARRNRPADRVESRGKEYHERVRNGFLEEARRQPGRLVVVDASLDVATVQQRIREEVERVLAAHTRS